MSMTSLPSRWVANRWSSSRSRGGGTSSISALAASMRNFGFEVRAGGTATQPGQLLADEVLPAASRRPRLALALGLGQHERRVAALVGVDHAVVDLPRRLADLVEEPAVVGDDDQRATAGRRGAAASQATASTSRWLVGSSSTIRSWSPSSSAASAQRRRSPPESPSDGAVERDAGEQLLDDLAHAWSRRPTRGRPRPPSTASRTRVGVDELVALVEVADLDARGCARPGRRRAPRARSSPRAGWSCRRRCGRRCRSARPREMPSETSSSSGRTP